KLSASALTAAFVTRPNAYALVQGLKDSLKRQRGEEDDNDEGSRSRDHKKQKIQLVNTSDTGKTRVLLEHLCRLYGIYFIAATGTDDVGSSDLKNAIGMLQPHPEMKEIDYAQNLDAIEFNSANNRANIETGLKRILTARWILFHASLE
ncbi:hypothetical protein FRC17_001841, partial [Serendipita sp. 399]